MQTEGQIEVPTTTLLRLHALIQSFLCGGEKGVASRRFEGWCGKQGAIEPPFFG